MYVSQVALPVILLRASAVCIVVAGQLQDCLINIINVKQLTGKASDVY